MEPIIREANVRAMLAQLNVALEDAGYALRYKVEVTTDYRGIWYLLRDAKTDQNLSNWMRGREVNEAMGIILASLPLLKEPTLYQVLTEKVLHLNDLLALANSPHRFRLDWPDDGLCTLTRLTVDDPSGKDTIAFYKGKRFTEEEMIEKVTATTDQVEFMYGLLQPEVE